MRTKRDRLIIACEAYIKARRAQLKWEDADGTYDWREHTELTNEVRDAYDHLVKLTPIGRDIEQQLEKLKRRVREYFSHRSKIMSAECDMLLDLEDGPTNEHG